MTTHEFARQLLAGRNIPVVVPKVIKYDDGEYSCADPVVDVVAGVIEDKDCKVAMISYKSDKPVRK